MFEDADAVAVWFAGLVDAAPGSVRVERLDDGVFYVSESGRGGRAAVASSVGEFLLAASAEAPETHVARFRAGERTLSN